MSGLFRLHPPTPATTTSPRRRLRASLSYSGLAVTACLVVCLLSTTACDRLSPPGLELEFTSQHLAELTDSLNDHVARGDLTQFTTGRNDYIIRLPGAAVDARFALDLAEKTVFVPFGFARVRLNGLRFTRASCRWDPGRSALQVGLDIADREDGVLAELHTPVGVEDMAFFVSGGRVTSYLHPTVSRDGRLAWEPLAVEISVNTDDAIPAVRGPLRDALRDVERDIQRQLQPQFEAVEDDMAEWVADRMAARSSLRAVTILPDRAVLSAERGDIPEDIDRDGRVDIADVVAVAAAFGGRTSGPADVNGDGRVDITDLVAVAVMFGR